ncbi:hypothetical protein M408DRAFT_325741, partial [Serendipita vermifera MAFF 305830]
MAQVVTSIKNRYSIRKRRDERKDKPNYAYVVPGYGALCWRWHWHIQRYIYGAPPSFRQQAL